MVKALFWWRVGSFPQTASGEVEISDKGLIMRLPLALSRMIPPGTLKTMRDHLKESIKSGLVFSLLGFGGEYLAKGKPIAIPFEYISSTNLVERKMGLMGQRQFIELKLNVKGKELVLTFAPYRGTINREYIIEEWLEQFKEAIENYSQTITPPEQSVEKSESPPEREHVEEEEEGVEETPVEVRGILRFDVSRGVFVRSPVIKLKVETQGVSEDFKANGSFDVIDRGVLTLDEAINLFMNLPDSYPAEVTESSEFCPVNMVVTREEGDYISIFLESDHVFAVFKSLTNETKSGLTREEAIEFLKEFYGRK